MAEQNSTPVSAPDLSPIQQIISNPAPGMSVPQDKPEQVAGSQAVTGMAGDGPSVATPFPPAMTQEQALQQNTLAPDIVSGPAMAQMEAEQKQAPQQPQLSANDFAIPEQQSGQLPQEQANNPQKVINAADDYFKQAKAANQAAADAGNQLGQMQAGAYKQLQADLTKQQAENDLQLQKYKEEVGGELTNLNQIRTDLSQISNQKVDSNHFWDSKSTGQKVTAGIALFLGGLSGGLTKTNSNPAIEIFNKAIDQDISAQKFNIQQAREGKMAEASVSNSILAQFERKYNNTQQAEAAARLVLLDKAHAQLNQYAAQYTSQDAQAKMMQANALLSQQKMVLEQQFQQAGMQQKLLGKALQGQGAGELSPAEVQMLPPEVQKKYVPGYGVAPNEKLAEGFSVQRARFEPGIQSINGILNDMKDVNRISDPAKRAALQTKVQQTALGLVAPLSDSKRFNPEELHKIESFLGDPSSFTSITPITIARLNAVKNALQSDLNIAAKASGLGTKTLEKDILPNWFTPNKK